jgi:hypothetical protein
MRLHGVRCKQPEEIRLVADHRADERPAGDEVASPPIGGSTGAGDIGGRLVVVWIGGQDDTYG